MPRIRPNGPSWDQLYAVAEPQSGYVTSAQAQEAGYSQPLLHYHVRKGRLERVARGIYRLVHFPASDHEDLVVVWLWSGQEGVFSHETALSLHCLSDALPASKHLTVPASWATRRLRVPPETHLVYADIPARDRTWVGSVPVTTPLRTVLDIRAAHVDPELVRQATAEGLERGLFSKQALQQATAGRGSGRGRRGRARRPG